MKHYFRLKGEAGEGFVHKLAEGSFLVDWVYTNPKWPDGKELCDLLVVFGETAIIWQIKNLKLREDGKFNKVEVEKNLKQLSGARRRLFELKHSLLLENPRRGSEEFNPNGIAQVFLISVLLGGNETHYSFYEEYKNQKVHVFNESFTEIVLNELDTISDFIEYLQKKSAFLDLEKQIIINGGEENLLGCYLANARSFTQFEDKDLCIIENDIWEGLKTNPAFQKKYEEDEISYGWDEIIDKAHTTGSDEYEKVARELARPNRFLRRLLSQYFFEAHKTAHLGKKTKSFRRVLKVNGFTFAFVFLDKDESREYRKKLLFAVCYYARAKFQENTKVLGIATERKFTPQCSYDFCLLNFPNWTDECQRKADELVNDLGLFRDGNVIESKIDEFPKGL